MFASNVSEREPVVLLHGSANGAFSWTQVQTRLKRVGLQAYAPDMLGYGSSPQPPEPYRISDEVAHLQGLIDAQGIDRFQLVAHSVGCLYGLHLRLALGTRVTRMTLLDPVMAGVLRELADPTVFQELEALHRQFLRLYPNPVETCRIFVDYWNGVGAWDKLSERSRVQLSALSSRLHLELLVTGADETRTATFAQNPVPTTILLGEHTRAVPPAVTQRLAPAFQAQVLVVPGAGHMIPFSHPDAVVDAILKTGEPGPTDAPATTRIPPSAPQKTVREVNP